MWIVINIVCYLIDAWQGMQYLHVVLCQGKHRTVKDIHVFDTLIFHQIRETFFLDPCHVDNVGIGNGVLVEISMLHIFYPMFLTVYLVFLWHCKFLWCNEMECRIKVAHGSD